MNSGILCIRVFSSCILSALLFYRITDEFPFLAIFFIKKTNFWFLQKLISGKFMNFNIFVLWNWIKIFPDIGYCSFYIFTYIFVCLLTYSGIFILSIFVECQPLILQSTVSKEFSLHASSYFVNVDFRTAIQLIPILQIITYNMSFHVNTKSRLYKPSFRESGSFGSCYSFLIMYTWINVKM